MPKPNSEQLEKRKSRVHSNFNEVLDNYIGVRLPTLEHHAENTSLPVFADTLKCYSRYSSWRELSSLSYGGTSTACSIVSSIEFDKDREVFAVAGVTKKIKVGSFPTHHL